MPYEGDDQVMNGLQTLAMGPLKGVRCFNGYLANGFRFHTLELQKKRMYQNSGVMVKGTSGDKEQDYFGILTDIIELQYLNGKRLILFRCDWWDTHKIGRGIKIDKYGIISVNKRCHLRTNEPFVLMSQAKQVFYVNDGFDPNWLVVVKSQPRHHYNVLEKEIVEDEEAIQILEPNSSKSAEVEEIDDTPIVVRDDIDDVVVDATAVNQPKDLNANCNEDSSSDDDLNYSVESEDDSDDDIDIA